MITREQIMSFSKKLNYNVAQVEKDYLQHLYLKFLYSITGNEFIFKGGTALQKCLGLPRFSEDLDFTFQGAEGNIPNVVEKTCLKVTELYETTFKKVNPRRAIINSEKYKLKIKGPLYTNDQSIVNLTLDISYREPILSEPDFKTINPLYDDIPTYSVTMMPNEELLSEKIRAIITRDKSRDVYDLWYLLGKKIPINKEYANKKLGLYEIAYSDNLLAEKIKDKRNIWNSELSNLILKVPEFKLVCDEINSYLDL